MGSYYSEINLEVKQICAADFVHHISEQQKIRKLFIYNDLRYYLSKAAQYFTEQPYDWDVLVDTSFPAMASSKAA